MRRRRQVNQTNRGVGQDCGLVIRRPFDSADLGMREYTKKKQQQSEQLILLGLFVELAKRRR